ncbi:TPA: hypothetical protein HA344_00810, partial [Candidatus Bathyarchaeota archaeon]|nr:hypothetical protein [Candidatus Bathyarchaeota archaeon]
MPVYAMDSKLVLVAVVCVLGGLVGGYMLANFTSTNQSAAYELQIQNLRVALNASDAQIGVLEVELQAK